MRPLYHEASQRLEWRGGHAGLWYDKFCDTWKDDWSGLGDEGKKEWVKSVTGKPVGDSTQLQTHAVRLTRLLTAHGQTPLPYTLESPFVTGLGRAHPVENGFAWHHTLGTPYLPGSSVKGMVRAWAEVWEGVDKPTLKRIFGSESDKDKNFQVGSVVFLDAIPTAPVQLKADVMTPHYGPWYRGEAPPADWHSPIPVPFLVVDAGATFLFGVFPRRDDDQSKQDCETVKGWLTDALCWTGAGAKTAVGYGRFKSPDAGVKARGPTLAQVAPVPKASPVDELVEGLSNVSKRDIKVRAQGFVDKLLRLDVPDAERQRAAAEMLKILENSRVSQINKLNAYRQLSKLRGE